MITYDEYIHCKGLIGVALCNPNRDNFCKAFADTQKYLGLDDLYIAQKLQISKPTVGRWAQGVSCVHPVGRVPILTWLLKQLDNHAS